MRSKCERTLPPECFSCGLFLYFCSCSSRTFSALSHRMSPCPKNACPRTCHVYDVVWVHHLPVRLHALRQRPEGRTDVSTVVGLVRMCIVAAQELSTYVCIACKSLQSTNSSIASDIPASPLQLQLPRGQVLWHERLHTAFDSFSEMSLQLLRISPPACLQNGCSSCEVIGRMRA